MRRVLMVTYFFPPLGGGGIQRVLKFATYLPRAGWQPVVVTPRNADYEPMDPDLVSKIPSEAEVHRSFCWEPSRIYRWLVRVTRYQPTNGGPPVGRTAVGSSSAKPQVGRWARLAYLLFFPDMQLFWIPFAVRSAIRAHRALPVSVIYSSSPPVSTHLIAGLVKRSTGLPWVADFRDPWIGNAFAPELARPQRWLRARVERWIVHRADRVVFATPSLTGAYAARYPDVASRFVTITNGYDAADLRAVRAVPEDGPIFRLAYVGSLYGQNELRIFLAGLQEFLASQPAERQRLRVEFVGLLSAHNQAIADWYSAPERLGDVVAFAGFVPQQEALRRLESANAALLLVAGDPGMNIFVAGKLYEYLGADKPVLAMVPEGDARAILRDLDWGVITEPNANAVAEGLGRLLAAPAPERPADPDRRYERTQLAAQLADLLSAVEKPEEAGEQTRTEPSPPTRIAAMPSSLRVLLLTHYYAPELGAPQTRLRETAAALSRLGHSVRVLTGPPHYPDGVVRHGYRAWLPSVETLDGVRIRRLPMWPRTNGGLVDRTIDQASFAVVAMTALREVRWADIVVVESPPLFLGLTAAWYSRVLRRPYVFHVADPWPDFPISMGALRNPIAKRVAFAIEGLAYRRARLITTVTRGLVDLLERKPAARGKVRLVPNGVDRSRFDPTRLPGDAQAALGWPPAALHLVYVGSVGLAQGLETLLDAVEPLGGAGVVVHIVGQGFERAMLERQSRERGLDHVHFEDPVPVERVPGLLAAADAVVVMLREGPLGEHSLPTKLLEGLAAGRPIVVSASGEAARLVAGAAAGLAAPAGDVVALRTAIEAMIDADRPAMGAAASNLAAAYDRGAIVERLAGLLGEASAPAVTVQPRQRDVAATDIEYWNDRVRRYGHTGESDPATYWYDQRLRLFAIEKAVLASRPAGGRALDFGCGVGDFCVLLSAHFDEVVGFDPSSAAIERASWLNGAPNIQYTGDFEQAVGHSVDLILAVTVFQHLMRDDDLRRELARLVETLAPGGRIAVMETFAEKEVDGGYIKRRTLPGLLDLFREAGMELIAQHSFYHPTECPTPAFLRYRGRLIVRILGRLTGMKVPLAQGLLAGIARGHADRDAAYLDQPGSPTKILVFGRRGA